MQLQIERIDYQEAETILENLVELLVDCVNQGDGASISFHLPLNPQRAASFWRSKFADIANNQRILLVAKADNRIVGTVMAEFMTVDNQPHRGEVQKLLVHSDFRRGGIAKALMIAIEQASLAAERTLLVLDTVKGGPAEKLYSQLGWQRVGEIPRFAVSSTGLYESTAIFYKDLLNP